jgi:ABC-2 type transport system ATP-binding protein
MAPQRANERLHNWSPSHKVAAFSKMPPPTEASVRVRDLSKSYGPVAAVLGVALEAYPGEIFGLLGPNGAGKTTILECILGLRRPDSGSIVVGGIDAVARSRDARRICGAQIQAANLQDKITPRRALELFASFYSPHAEVNGLIARFGLAVKADAPFDTLSAGQRQRLFLALAFVNDPSVVVLDEPTAGLDPLARRELHEHIAEIRESGRTVLLSTHDLAEAQILCDRVGILDAGRMVAAGTVGELLAKHGTSASVQFRTRRPLERERLLSLPFVKDCGFDAGIWSVATASVNETVVGLIAVVGSGGNELLELQVLRPTLEDAFLNITGRRWQNFPEGAP